MSESDHNPKSAPPQAVTVDIYDQTYHLSGDDPAYIQKLAEIVDGKMRLVASHGRTVDSLRVAVLAALNIADELATLESHHNSLDSATQESGNLRSRAHTLTGLLDALLEDPRKLG